MNTIRQKLENTKVGRYLDTKLSNQDFDMTVLEALAAVKDTMPQGFNQYYLKNPLQMTFPYKGGRIASIVGNSTQDYRHPKSHGAQGINNTFDAIVQGYRQHSTRNMGIGSRYEAENLQPNTPMLIQDGGRLLLAQTPLAPSAYPWVQGAVTSKVGFGSRFPKESIINIEDPEVLARWARLENWSEDFARPYFAQYKRSTPEPNPREELQIGMPFRRVREIGVSPYEVKQGQVIATPVSRPIVLNSQPNPKPAMTPIEADFWKQIGEFNPDLDAPFIPRVDVNNQPVQNWTLPQPRRMASDVLEPRGEVLPQVASDLGQQYLAMQDSLADLAYAAQSQYGLRDMASSYYP